MKIIDYSSQNYLAAPIDKHSKILEIITATLLFVVPVLTLFFLTK